MMDLVETARGMVYSCHCGKVIRVQQKQEEEEVPVAEPIDTTYVEDDENAKRVQKAARRKRARKRVEYSNAFLENWHYYTGGLGAMVYVILGLLGLWGLATVVSVALPKAAMVFVSVGFFIYLGGYIWLIIIAFQDNPTSGMLIVAGTLCWIAQLFSIVYIIMNIGETWKALILIFGGLAIFITAIIAGAAAGTLPNMAR
jgi:hypothetical protein